ncbi:MAG: Rrf2 family transcriptional regulator [Leptospirales bacterium]|nr:Rrf2 family transcriptional regulator [Leptospirales bacterium]
MSGNSRLSIAVHALLLMEGCAARGKTHATSEEIAASVNTNPVVVRRLMPSLVAAGILAADRGPHGGYRLLKSAAQISVAEVYRAVAEGPLFGRHPTPNPNCPVGRGVDEALSSLYEQAETRVLEAFGKRSIRSLARDFVQV